MYIHLIRKPVLCLLAAMSLCAVRNFAADKADEQRARQLMQKQESGQPLTVEEKRFLQQMKQQLRKGGSMAATQDRGAANAARPRASQEVGGKEYYIANTGKDTNTGASDSPWATIAHAAA